MTKTILLTLLVFSMSFIKAQNNLVVFTLESKPFYVVLNGIRQNYSPETNVKIEGLPGEFYRIKVIFEDRSFSDVEKTVNFLEKNQEMSMELKLKNGKFKMRFAGVRDLNQSTSANDNVVNNNESNNTQNSEPSVVTYHNEEWSETEQQNYQINVNINGTNQTSSTNTSNEAGEHDVYYNFMSNGTLCSSPNVDDKSFLDFKYEIENANMFKRQEKILKYFQDHCMRSSQVAGIINIDYPTVDGKTIAKEGYRNTYDTENYYVVLDALTNESDRQNVIKFLGLNASDTPYTNQTNVNNSSSQNSNNGNNNVNENQVNYSLIPSYSGYINCNKGSLINDIDKLLKAVNNESFGDDKLNVIKQATNQTCLRVSDLEQLIETFNHSSEKMELLKWAWDYTYDIDNFYKLSSSMTFSGDKEELDQFIDQQPTSHFQYVYSTDNSDGALIHVDNLEERMDNEAFTDNKMILAKQALVSRYINVAQIKQLAPQFAHESDLIEFIEMAYPRTLDKENFYTLNEILTFSSSKDRLNQIMGE